jgi:hypothetical protein
MAVHDMGLLYVDFYWTWTFFSGKKLIFDAILGKKAHFFLLNVAEYIFKD